MDTKRSVDTLDDMDHAGISHPWLQERHALRIEMRQLFAPKEPPKRKLDAVTPLLQRVQAMDEEKRDCMLYGLADELALSRSLVQAYMDCPADLLPWFYRAASALGWPHQQVWYTERYDLLRALMDDVGRLEGETRVAVARVVAETAGLFLDPFLERLSTG